MEGTDCLYEGNGAEDRRERIVYTKASAQRMGGDGSFVWCGRRKVYRLFTDTSVHPLGQYGNNDLFVWEHRSFPSVGKSAKVRRCGTAHA